MFVALPKATVLALGLCPLNKASAQQSSCHSTNKGRSYRGSAEQLLGAGKGCGEVVGTGQREGEAGQEGSGTGGISHAHILNPHDRLMHPTWRFLSLHQHNSQQRVKDSHCRDQSFPRGKGTDVPFWYHCFSRSWPAQDWTAHRHHISRVLGSNGNKTDMFSKWCSSLSLTMLRWIKYLV